MSSAPAPRFFSTRDPKRITVSFREALLAGLAPDGGLYVPDRIPVLASDWPAAEDFPSLALSVLDRWVTGEPGQRLAGLVRSALDFPVPLTRLSADRFLLELFHGPTLSFKDFGARVMARLMNAYLAREGRSLTILVATSGDTGSAVADGFAGQDNIRVVLLYPRGMVSPIQERQLIVRRRGVTAFAVEGTFDDCQRLVKGAFADPALAGLSLSSANSINIGRLLPQSLYYLWAGALLARQGVDPNELVICVPSGNLGNLTGAVLAQRMGLPVVRLIAAHNANAFFPSFLAARRAAFQFLPTVATLSNAMDVGAPSNFERLLALLGEEGIRAIWGTSVDDADTLGALQGAWQGDGRVVCPHTAVGLAALERYRRETGHTGPGLVVATAHPAKFPEVVAKALGRNPPPSEVLSALARLPTRVERLAPDPASLREQLLGLA